MLPHILVPTGPPDAGNAGSVNFMITVVASPRMHPNSFLPPHLTGIAELEGRWRAASQKKQMSYFISARATPLPCFASASDAKQ